MDRRVIKCVTAVVYYPRSVQQKMPPPRELLDSIALTDVACLVNSQDNDGAVVSRIRRKVVDFLLLQGGKSLDVRHQQ